MCFADGTLDYLRVSLEIGDDFAALFFIILNTNTKISKNCNNTFFKIIMSV